MAHNVRIDDDVYKCLEQAAIPFVDKTPCDVIRRLLTKEGLLPLKRKKKVSPPAIKVEATPQKLFEQWLLYILWHEYKGKASKNDATQSTIIAMENANILCPKDYERVSTGESRAVNMIAWSRNELKNEGIIKPDSERGIWELTSKGINEAKKIKL